MARFISLNTKLVVAALVVMTISSFSEAAKKKAPSKPSTSQPADKDAAAPAVFAPLPVHDPITTIAATDDGRLLLLASESANTVTVWDVAESKVTATIRVIAPRAMLSRGGKLYVGSYGHGKVLVFDEATWKQTDELLTGLNDIVFLSAASGTAFHDQLIAICRAGSPGGRDDFDTAVVMDVAHDTRRAIAKAGIVTPTADGEFIVRLSSPADVWPTETWMANAPMLKFENHQSFDGQFAMQIGSEPLFLSDHGVYTLPKLQAVEQKLGLLVMRDVTQPAIYALNDGELSASAANATLDPLGRRAVTLDDKGKKSAREIELKKVFNTEERRHDGYYDAPIAITLGDRLYIFFHGGEKPSVQGARLEAFKVDPSLAAHAAGTNSNLATTQPGAPSEVVAGKLFQFTVPTAGGEKLTLMSAPPGMMLSLQNVLSWTPPPSLAGTTQAVKVRVDKDGQSLLGVLPLAGGIPGRGRATADRA